MLPADYKVFQQIQQITGHRVRLSVHETIKQYSITDTLIMVTVNTFKVKTLAREDRFTKSGIKLLVWQETPNGVWHESDSIVVWDESYVPVTDVHYGKTDQEKEESAAWADLCYRPGTSKTPMDSFDRTVQEQPAPKMVQHYFGKKGITSHE